MFYNIKISHNLKFLIPGCLCRRSSRWLRWAWRAGWRSCCSRSSVISWSTSTATGTLPRWTTLRNYLAILIYAHGHFKVTRLDVQRSATSGTWGHWLNSIVDGTLNRLRYLRRNTLKQKKRKIFMWVNSLPNIVIILDQCSDQSDQTMDEQPESQLKS